MHAFETNQLSMDFLTQKIDLYEYLLVSEIEARLGNGSDALLYQCYIQIYISELNDVYRMYL